MTFVSHRNMSSKMNCDMYERLNERYSLYLELYGFCGRIWSQLYEEYSSNVFCKANKKSIISMYLELEDFVNAVNKYNSKADKKFVYYYGIDEFLKEYHDAVYNCLNLD